MSTNPKADAWMPLYIADYARDTFHLTRDQHGGYLLLLMACWTAGGRLPNDPKMLAAICKATPAEWRTLGKVLLPFFKTQGKWLVHKRVSAERQKAQRLLETKRENGRKGGRPKNRSETDRFSLGSQNQNLDHNRDETPARVKVDVLERSVQAEASPFPIQEEASEALGTEAKVIPLAGRGSA